MGNGERLGLRHLITPIKRVTGGSQRLLVCALIGRMVSRYV